MPCPLPCAALRVLSASAHAGGGASARGGAIVRHATNLSMSRGSSEVLASARCHKSECITTTLPAAHSTGRGQHPQVAICSPKLGMCPRE
eukprot:3845052-Pleurochrysis_carterae.AAC.1